MSIHQLLQSVSEHVQASASVKNIFGDPVFVEGRTIIPVARVAYGFGGGSGPVWKRQSQTEDAQAGGGGGGARVYPVGALELTANGTRFIPFGQEKQIAIALVAGIVAGLLLSKYRSRRY